MLTRIETQSRKKAKLTPYMDILDFQIILLSGLILPFIVWMFTGYGMIYSMWIVLVYIVWMFYFKIDKPPGYWNHFLNHKTRGKAWVAYNPTQAKDVWFKIKTEERDENSLN